MINVSDYDLNEHELSVLKKGLNFAVTLAKIPVNDMITVVESTISMSAEIRNKDIMIVPADKSWAVVVMKTTDSLLSDAKTSKKLKF